MMSVLKAVDLLDNARGRGILIATAESCTGGLVSAALTDIPGSSRVVDRGFVTYSNEAKVEMLGVDPELIATHGAVSEEVARAMAIGALTHSRAQLSIATTGVAGPGGSESKPEGLVWFGVAFGDRVRTDHRRFGAIGRANVRAATVEIAVDMAIQLLARGP
ncbi:CinA family protein [Amaricoccus macauensis]|uniref:CinA family protein n=1 Tax=Amaricoccus macauensis TaxID=57001 RepID=UPI003C7C0445